MANLKVILIIVLLGLFTVLVIQNTEVIDVRFFAYDVAMSRIVLLLLTLLLGFVIGFITAKRAGRRPRAKQQARRDVQARNQEETTARPKALSQAELAMPSGQGDRSVINHGSIAGSDSILSNGRSGPKRP